MENPIVYSRIKTAVYFLIFLLFFHCLNTNTVQVKAELSGIPALYKGYVYTESKKYPDEVLPYRIYAPDDYQKKSYPLVLHFNGAGENGNDNEKQIDYPNIITQLLLEDDNYKKYPCVILAPQCPDDDRWVTNFYGDISKTMEMTIELLDDICNQYNVDRNRLYVSGYSSGGSGTWDIIYRYPNMFAAAIPIAGYTAPVFGDVVKDVPIWIFHTDNDPTVPETQARNMVNGLKSAGSTVVKYTVYNASDKNLAHKLAWEAAFQEEDLLPWLFSQKNKNSVNIHNEKNSKWLEKIDKIKSIILFDVIVLGTILVFFSIVILLFYEKSLVNSLYLNKKYQRK